MFRNLMGCGRVEGTKEPTVLVKSVSKGEMKGSIIPYNCVTLKRQDHQIYRSFGTPLNQQQRDCKNSRHDFIKGGHYKHRDNKESVEQKSISAAYKPINCPKCSHCKKRFNPEKLHSHMKSCKGVKTRTKVSKSIDEAFNVGSASGPQLER